jgi:hypothetical protein
MFEFVLKIVRYLAALIFGKKGGVNMSFSRGCDPCDFGLYQTTDNFKKVIWNNQCSGSSGGCLVSDLYSPLPSEEREFHPEELRDATVQINGILEKLRRSDKGRRTLSFLRVPGGGLMLAWSDHEGKLPSTGVINSESSPDEIKHAMGLTSSKSGYESDHEKSRGS